MSTRILLIRHAATDTHSRLCGSFDVPLTASALAQVHALLRDHRTRPVPAALFTSTLTRAKAVAVPLGRVWAREPRPAEWAREIHCGDVEGMPLEQLRRDFPDLWVRNLAQTDDSFAWPGGETYSEFRARVIAGLRATAAAHAGERIAVVTHAGVISQILGTIRGRPASVWSADRPDPLTATEIAFENGAPAALLTYNDPHWY